MINELFQDHNVNFIGKNTLILNNITFHYRFKQLTKGKYPFNINRNTLNCNYEVLICGGLNNYFIIPIDILKGMYNHPNGYIDRHHPDIRIYNIDLNDNLATYARPGLKIDFSPFKNNINIVLNNIF